MLTIDKGEGCALKRCSVQKPWAHASLSDACQDAIGVRPVGRPLPCSSNILTPLSPQKL